MGTCYVCHIRSGDRVELEFYFSEDYQLVANAYICDWCWENVVKKAAVRVDVQADRREGFEETFFKEGTAYIRKWYLGGPY